MKKSEIEKPINPLLVNSSVYVSNSMIIKNNYNKLNDTENLLLNENTINGSDTNKLFDVFAHILEG